MDITSKTRIQLTKHVLQRVRERFGDKIGRFTANDNQLRRVVMDHVTTGQILDDWKRVPFYMNAIATSKGSATEIIRSNGIFYLCNYHKHQDVLQVLTAVPRMLYYPTGGTFAIGSPGGARWVNEERFIEKLHKEAIAEYTQRHGRAPEALWRHAQSVKKQAENQLYNKKQTVLDKLAKYEREIAKPSLSLAALDGFYEQRDKVLVSLGQKTIEHDIERYTHLKRIAEREVTMYNNSPNKVKWFKRYSEELERLTTAK